MNYLASLEKAVGAALARKQIGRPVALRIVLQVTADHGLVVPVAAQAVEMAQRWFGSVAVRVYAQGGARSGFVSVLAEFAAGETALIAAEAGTEPPAVLVLLIGNHGTLQYDDAREAVLAQPADSPLRRVIERSLESRRPEAVSRG